MSRIIYKRGASGPAVLSVTPTEGPLEITVLPRAEGKIRIGEKVRDLEDGCARFLPSEIPSGEFCPVLIRERESERLPALTRSGERTVASPARAEDLGTLCALVDELAAAVEKLRAENEKLNRSVFGTVIF